MSPEVFSPKNLSFHFFVFGSHFCFRFLYVLQQVIVFFFRNYCLFPFLSFLVVIFMLFLFFVISASLLSFMILVFSFYGWNDILCWGSYCEFFVFCVRLFLICCRFRYGISFFFFVLTFDTSVIVWTVFPLFLLRVRKPNRT